MQPLLVSQRNKFTWCLTPTRTVGLLKNSFPAGSRPEVWSPEASSIGQGNYAMREDGQPLRRLETSVTLRGRLNRTSEMARVLLCRSSAPMAPKDFGLSPPIGSARSSPPKTLDCRRDSMVTKTVSISQFRSLPWWNGSRRKFLPASSKKKRRLPGEHSRNRSSNVLKRHIGVL